jgi:hypothetical protein
MPPNPPEIIAVERVSQSLELCPPQVCIGQAVTSNKISMRTRYRTKQGWLSSHPPLLLKPSEHLESQGNAFGRMLAGAATRRQDTRPRFPKVNSLVASFSSQTEAAILIRWNYWSVISSFLAACSSILRRSNSSLLLLQLQLAGLNYYASVFILL